MDEKRLQRLLRAFVHQTNFKPQTPSSDTLIVAVKGRRSKLKITRGELTFLQDQQFVVVKGFAIQSSNLGKIKLKRLLAGQNGFAAQHQSLCNATIESQPGYQQVVINNEENPLSWLRARRGKNGKLMISAEQFSAGDRLRRDFTYANMLPRVTSNWSGYGVGGKTRGQASLPGGCAELTDNAVIARQRVKQAVDAVGPELAGILIDICCFLKGLSQVEMERGWPRSSAKIVLQLSLDRLAIHYGLKRSRAEAGRPTS